MRSRAVIFAVLGAGLLACTAAKTPAARPSPQPTTIAYEVRLASIDPWILDVRATFEGGAARGAIAFPAAASQISVEERGARRSPEQHGRSFLLGCEGTCTVRYRYDLSAAAELTQDAASVAVRSGGDVVASGSIWLMRPEPVDPWARATLRVETGDSASFAAPFPRDEITGEYRLLARDIGALGYTVWGQFTTVPVRATEGRADVVVLRGERRADDAALGRWMTATAAALDTVYGRFPVPRVLVAVVPSPGSDGVDFGRTVPAGGASILLFVGDRASEDDLLDDWVLAHEMVHLGIPSMPRDGRWIDEGLATYYEPVIRARAGLLSERAAWAELRAKMPRGVATREEPSLATAEDHDRVYFGGGVFALAADVEIRQRTGGARSLDDGMRRALAEGASATLVWPIERFVAALDRGAGTPVVRELFERVSGRDAPCSPSALALSAGPSACAPDDAAAVLALFDALGVERSGGDEVELDDAARLAHVRRSIGRMDEGVAATVARSAPRTAAGAWSARTKAGAERP